MLKITWKNDIKNVYSTVKIDKYCFDTNYNY